MGESRKKSRIIPPERRKKVAQACDMCRRRKQKCNGLVPCAVCELKGATCAYTGVDRRVLKPTRRELEMRRLSSSLAQSAGPANPFGATELAARIPASLQPLLGFPLSVPGGDDAAVALGGDQNWRLLFDDGGNLRFLGESCGISYLLQCRKLFGRLLGAQRFSDDQQRLRYTDKPGIALDGSTISLPSREYADYLVRTFLSNLNNVLYINEEAEWWKLVESVYSRKDPRELIILHLVMAIGSMFAKAEVMNKLFPFARTVFVEHEVYFQAAMTLLKSTLEDGNLWLVEANLILFFYYHFSGYKHLAWVVLGSAIRHAHGLGLNRKYVNESFKDTAVVFHRRRLFRSLFIMDTISSVHLGRSMAIREQDWDDMKTLDTIDDFQNRLVQVCRLNSAVLSTIYFNKSVTIHSALELAVRMKLYSLRHPLKNVLPNNHTAVTNYKFLLPHVIYLHGIILLSRPFFHFVVLKKLGLVSYDPESERMAHLKSFYHSCIKASLLIIKTVEYCYYQNIHPFKPLSLVSCTFHAGLVLGLLLLIRHRGTDDEMFKEDPNIEMDLGQMLSSSMGSVIKVLVHCGQIDPQSKQYSIILQNMFDATQERPGTNTQGGPGSFHENFESILRFQDWLFPEMDSLAQSSAAAYDSTQPDDFLKDLAGLTNTDSSGQFFEDLLYSI